LASDTAAIAQRLIAAFDARTYLDPITANDAEFDTAAAYTVLHLIEADRHARGWRPIGRKIGFTNRTIWELYDVSDPM
jgi:2-oxo-3-hexenedioate decarboxylase